MPLHDMQSEIKKLLIDSKKFRAKLVMNMESLDKQSINCASCTGVCCTVARNSMQVTPIEALDLYFYLKEHIKDQEKLNEAIHESISKFGLDREIYIKGRLFRKNYTCPLFKFESWGCPVEASLKPLGCLGYNALGIKVLDGENCASDLTLLKSVDEEISAEFNELNARLSVLLNLSFEKTNIPAALVELSKVLTGM